MLSQSPAATKFRSGRDALRNEIGNFRVELMFQFKDTLKHLYPIYGEESVGHPRCSPITPPTPESHCRMVAFVQL